MKSEQPPTDQRASQRHKGFVYFWSPLIPDPQSAKLMQPGNGSLNHPSKYSQPAAVLGVALGQHRFNPSAPQLMPMQLRIISAVSLRSLWSPSRPARLALDGGNRIYQRQQLRYIVSIGSRQDH